MKHNEMWSMCVTVMSRFTVMVHHRRPSVPNLYQLASFLPSKRILLWFNILIMMDDLLVDCSWELNPLGNARAGRATGQIIVLFKEWKKPCDWWTKILLHGGGNLRESERALKKIFLGDLILLIDDDEREKARLSCLVYTRKKIRTTGTPYWLPYLL